MNAIVAIGGAELFRVVDAYRVLAPSAVWMLGTKAPRDPNDPLLRSLEALLEPFMDAYFAREAGTKIAAIGAHLTLQPLPVADVNQKVVVDAVTAVLAKNMVPTMALVEMLDRADLIQPVELVLTDGNTVLARAAAAWARARLLPAVIVPSNSTRRRPQTPSGDRTFISRERNRRNERDTQK